jgi:uncharacterized membrane protein
MIACITGFDKGGAVLYGSSPVITILLCLVKGIAAGYLAGIVYRAVARRNMYVGVILAAIVCPIVNTGIFLAAMVLFYRDTLTAWAAGTDLVYFTLIGLTGVNFLIELGSNLILGPVAVRIINAGRREVAA